jgi:hypothetical protein
VAKLKEEKLSHVAASVCMTLILLALLDVGAEIKRGEAITCRGKRRHDAYIASTCRAKRRLFLLLFLTHVAASVGMTADRRWSAKVWREV